MLGDGARQQEFEQKNEDEEVCGNYLEMMENRWSNFLHPDVRVTLGEIENLLG